MNRTLCSLNTYSALKLKKFININGREVILYNVFVLGLWYRNAKRPVRAAKCSFRLELRLQGLKVVIVHDRTTRCFSGQEVALDAARFDISPVLSKEKRFADIYSNDGFVRSIN